MLGRLLGYMMVSPQGRDRVVVPYGVVILESLEVIAADAVDVVEMGGLWL
jgi:hypothetical protein